MPFAETKTGARLFYEDINPDAEGLPVVCLHGLLGTGRKDLGAVLDWLAAEGYRVIAPSLRGYGESTPKPRDFPFGFYKRDAEDVLAFLEAIQVERCHLMGYSDGGEVSLICAGTKPELFASVATIGAVGFQSPDIRAVVLNYRPGSEWITPEECEMHGIPDPDAFSAQWVRSTVMLVDSGGDIAVSVAKHITAKVLVMLGVKDKLNPRECAEVFLKDVKNGRIEMFDAGHPVHEEQEAAFQEVFMQHIKS
jgi:pimeloyl-ACP methyl ester carboxylesterase